MHPNELMTRCRRWFRYRFPSKKEKRRHNLCTPLRLEALEDRCVPTTWAVTNADDNVAEMHTLRWAVANAVNGDTILIAADLKNTPIVLTQGELVLSQNVTIEGVGNVPETISGGGNSRVFEVTDGAHVTIDNLTLTGGDGVADNPNGFAPWFYDGQGGAILNFGMVTVSGCNLSGNSVFNHGGSGGAISSIGAMSLSNCTLDNNSAYFAGGAIWNNAIPAGVMTISNCTISNNFALIYGGGVLNLGTLTISSSTLSSNSVLEGGGAVYNASYESSPGTLTITDSTLSGNSVVGGVGGAILNFGTLTIADTTLFCNSASNAGAGTGLGGAIANFGTLTLAGSTFTNNSAANDGGGIYNAGIATVSTSVFTANSASSGGGVFNDTDGTLAVSGSTFSANTPDAIFGSWIDDGGNMFN